MVMIMASIASPTEVSKGCTAFPIRSCIVWKEKKEAEAKIKEHKEIEYVTILTNSFHML